MRIEWSLGAQDQLITARFDQRSTATLERFERELDDALDRLERFPESARQHPILGREDVRVLLVGDYRMTIVLTEEVLLVFSFIHTRSGAAFD
jgi:plasmid stabilization system protein ParE